MTPEQIDAMPAGGELDLMVHREIMHSIDARIDDDGVPREDAKVRTTFKCRVRIPEYSTDIAAAWEVFERVLKEHTLILTGDWEIAGGFVITDDLDCPSEVFVRANTAPLAICRAALKAVAGS